MPWEQKTVIEQREDFVLAAQECSNFSALCREWGISRKSGYKWVQRAAAGDALDDRSRRPRRVSNRTPEAVEGKILALRAQQPGWGARKLKVVLERSGEADIPCERTICRILRRHGCIDPEESRKRQPFQRFEREHCNELWQADFKGEFRTLDGRYCYPLDIIDDHSRFVLRIAAADRITHTVIPVFESAFREYGLPLAVLSDNGAPFAGIWHGYAPFEKWLMDRDVLPIHGRVGHPQTQGKIERFHGAMKREFLRYRSFANAARKPISSCSGGGAPTTCSAPMRRLACAVRARCMCPAPAACRDAFLPSNTEDSFKSSRSTVRDTYALTTSRPI